MLRISSASSWMDRSAGADVDVLFVVVVLHQETTGIGQVIDVQQLAPRLSGTSHTRSRLASGRARALTGRAS